MSETAAANSSPLAAKKFTHPRQRHPGIGQGADPDQLHHGRGVVAPVTGTVSARLGQQTLGMVMADLPHGDTGVGGQLANSQHGRDPLRSAPGIVASIQASLRR